VSDFRQITIEEDWEERPDGIYWKYRFLHEKNWHSVLTAYTKIPVVKIQFPILEMELLPQKDLNQVPGEPYYGQ